MSNWFLVKLVFKIVCGPGTHRPQYDEQWRLLMASCKEEVIGKAAAMAREEGRMEPGVAAMVNWIYIGASAIIPLTGVADGAEIHSTIREPWDEQAYRQQLHADMLAIECKPDSLSL